MSLFWLTVAAIVGAFAIPVLGESRGYSAPKSFLLWGFIITVVSATIAVKANYSDAIGPMIVGIIYMVTPTVVTFIRGAFAGLFVDEVDNNSVPCSQSRKPPS